MNSYIVRIRLLLIDASMLSKKIGICMLIGIMTDIKDKII